MPIDTVRRNILLGIAALLLAAGASARTPASLCAASARGIPQRSAQAHSASEFVAAVVGMSERERDSAIRGELLAGNIPGFLRHGVPATLNATLLGGETVALTLCVLADYLSLGADDDFLREPNQPRHCSLLLTRGLWFPTTSIRARFSRSSLADWVFN